MLSVHFILITKSMKVGLNVVEVAATCLENHPLSLHVPAELSLTKLHSLLNGDSRVSIFSCPEM